MPHCSTPWIVWTATLEETPNHRDASSPRPDRRRSHQPCTISHQVALCGRKEAVIASTTFTAKGWITIPKGIRDQMRLRPGDRLDVSTEGDRIVITPVTLDLDDSCKVLPSPKRVATLAELEATIRRRRVRGLVEGSRSTAPAANDLPVGLTSASPTSATFALVRRDGDVERSQAAVIYKVLALGRHASLA